MSRTLVDRLRETEEGKRLYEQERTILDVTELICEIMEEEGVSRSELARRLSRSKGYVTQLLDGRANMTVRTISDVFHALGRRLSLRAAKQLEPSVRAREGMMLFRSSVWEQCLSWHPGTEIQGPETINNGSASESLVA